MAPQEDIERKQELARTTFCRAEQLFHATCRMTPDEREAYLLREGVSDAVRREVAALLECDDIQGDAFDEAWLPPSREAAPAFAADSRLTASIGPGTVLGDFRLEEEVGRGGMAIVYRAQQLSLDRTVALKVLCFPWMTAAVRQRFQREAAAGAQLHHDNIVTVYYSGQQDDCLFFAMELVEGPTLAEWLAEQRSQDTKSSRSANDRYAQVCRWAADVASGLAHAHANGVIHRDTKPSNLIITPEGRVKIVDFGIAKLGREAGLTRTGTLIGTPRYMSPEQLSPAEEEVDHRADIYSLGATLYELLTLRPPFAGDHYGQVISQICETEPRPPRYWDRQIPRPLETICLKAMAREPRNRYQDAGELAGDLRNWLAGRPIAAVRRGPLARLARTALRPRNQPTAAMTALLLACGAAIAWWVGPMSRQLGILGDSIWIASTDGGMPRRFCPQFEMASYPVWSPDGTHLLFKGILPSRVASERQVTDQPDWWVAPVNGGQPAKPLGIVAWLGDAGVAWTGLCAPNCWTPRSHRVLFSGFSHSTLKLWSLPLSPKRLAVTGPPGPLTTGGANEYYPGTDSGLGAWELCCFSSGEFDYGVWSLPIDADQAVVKGEITCVEPNPAMDMTPSVSTDGRRLVFESLRGGPFDVWYKEGGRGCSQTNGRAGPEGLSGNLPRRVASRFPGDAPPHDLRSRRVRKHDPSDRPRTGGPSAASRRERCGYAVPLVSILSPPSSF